MTHRTPKALVEDYVRMNKSWPTPMPNPTYQELADGARRLFAKFNIRSHWTMPRTWQTGGNRWTRFYYGKGLAINPANGWQALVHHMSHYLGGGHHEGHLRMEWDMIKHVRDSGWLEGKLRKDPPPAKPKVPAKVRRAAKAKTLLARAEKDLASAQARVKKWKETVRYYEKTLQLGPG